MRNMLILLALAVLTATSGCSRCRNLFRRGSPCGGTALAAPPMLGGAIPLGNPVGFQQTPQIVPQHILTQPNSGCQQAAPMCCEPCPSDCAPCESGYIGGETGYGSQTAEGEFFGGWVEGSAPPPGAIEGSVMPQGSSAYPGPVTGN